MKWFLVFSIFILSVIATKTVAEKICIDETQEEICDSFHVQCGVRVRVEDFCGNIKEFECKFPENRSCSLENLTCN